MYSVVPSTSKSYVQQHKLNRPNALYVTLRAAQGLPSASNYLVLSVGPSSRKITDISPPDPTWGARFSFGNTHDADAVLFHVYESGLVKDTLLGTCMLLLDFVQLEEGPLDRWIPLISPEGSQAGLLSVFVIGEFSERPPPEVLVIGIHEASGITESDAEYMVAIELNATTRNTVGISGTSRPNWNEYCTLMVRNEDTLRVQLIKKELVTKDTIIGSAELVGTELLIQKGSSISVGLTDPKGHRAGSLVLSISPDITETIPIKVIKAVGLVDDDTTLIGTSTKSDPYVILKLGDVTVKTAVKNDSKNPVWNETFTFTVMPKDSLEVTVKDRDVTIDDTLGKATISGMDLIGMMGKDQWVPLTIGKKAAGKILLGIANVPKEPTHEIKVRVMEAHSTADEDWLHKGDPYVKLQLGNVEFKTSIKDNTDKPVWDEEFTFRVAPSDSLEIQLMDDDVTVDDMLGRAGVPGSQLIASSGQVITVPLVDDDGRPAGNIKIGINTSGKTSARDIGGTATSTNSRAFSYRQDADYTNYSSTTYPSYVNKPVVYVDPVYPINPKTASAPRIVETTRIHSPTTYTNTSSYQTYTPTTYIDNTNTYQRSGYSGSYDTISYRPDVTYEKRVPPTYVTPRVELPTYDREYVDNSISYIPDVAHDRGVSTYVTHSSPTYYESSTYNNYTTPSTFTYTQDRPSRILTKETPPVTIIDSGTNRRIVGV